MRDALAKDSRIHRDISAGNIVLVQEPGSPVRRGYLVDWESSCKVDDKGEAVDSGRTVCFPLVQSDITRRFTHVPGDVAVHVNPPSPLR